MACKQGSLFLIIFILLSLSACSKIRSEASYPTRPDGADKIIYSDEKRTTVFGEGETLGSTLFGDEQDNTGGTGIGVNSFLWRATLDTLAFMPIQSADPFGGVILTDWYAPPETPQERFKMNAYILGRQLRADGIRVSIFKQTQNRGGWVDAAVSKDTATKLENAILTRARELRVTQQALDSDK